ncbi:hypothetical protein BpHYR1_026827 [Brachionus plicatilis]|uniref:Uncharacterized protein n=1 Tax=Brachionus plicatilis TaxID=10195 RepID=A0A3M7QCL1_BRAPC|nr:hypothetical protein BpHYR1_026827 [Brachionus plicatilis]
MHFTKNNDNSLNDAGPILYENPTSSKISWILVFLKTDFNLIIFGTKKFCYVVICGEKFSVCGQHINLIINKHFELKLVFYTCICYSFIALINKKDKSIAEESPKDFKICSHDLINVLNYENKKKSDPNLTTINFDRIQNSVFNSVNSHFLSKQFASNLVKKKTDNSTKSSYHIDLTSISKSGVFSLAPILSQSSIMIEPSHKKSIKMKSNIF